jgi:hypothetical protein
MHKQISAVAMVGVAALACGCSGGGGQSSLPAAAKSGGATAGTAKATLTIKIPARKASIASAKRLPKYVSAFTTELAIRAGTSGAIGAAAWQIFNVGPSAPAAPNISCSTDPTSGVRTCAATVTAPAVQGTVDEFQIGATDSTTVATDTQPTGNFLSTGDTTQTVTVGAANAVNVSLTPVIGVLTAVPPASYSVWAAPGQPANVVASITATDIDTGVIFGQPSAYANPLTFADGLTASPFTYPSANPPASYGLPPPAAAGPVLATIGYVAPATVAVPAATVTVSTIEPLFLPPPATPPTATFTLHAMVVSASAIATAGSGTAVGSLTLVTGRITFVTINESNAASFTVNTAPAGENEVALENATGGAFSNPLVPDATGNAVFLVVAGAPTTAATAPTITVTDNNGTVATLPVTITATLSPAASAVRSATHR